MPYQEYDIDLHKVHSRVWVATDGGQDTIRDAILALLPLAETEDELAEMAEAAMNARFEVRKAKRQAGRAKGTP